MFKALVDGMASLINYLYHFTVTLDIASYGLAIILLTVFIKLLLYPLTRIQMHSMTAMQQLQPEIKKIQEKYGKDKQMAQQKIMELYRERRVNPMSSCLLMLIQLPILIALYRALWTFEYVNPAHAAFLWVPSLSKPDPLYILPVLAALSTYFQSKLTMVPSQGTGGGTPGAEQTQKMMLYFMPVFIGWISISLPAGLSLYWVVFNVMGIIQQFSINKQLRPAAAGVGPVETAPVPTEEVKEVEQKRGSQRKKRRRSN